MDPLPTYRATARREGKKWIVRIHDLPSGLAGITQGHDWNDAKSMAYEVTSLLLQAPEETFNIDLSPEDPELAEAVEASRRARETARQAAAEATRANAEAATLLTRRGVRVRDAGAMLDLSPQYVSKLAPQGPREDQ